MYPLLKKILDPPLRNCLKKDKKVIKIPAGRSEANLSAKVFTRSVENSNSGLPSSSITTSGQGAT